MAFPTIRTKPVLLVLRVLFFLYLAFAVITVVVSYYDRPQPETWGGLISFILKAYGGLPTSGLMLDLGHWYRASDETLMLLLFIPIALNLLVLWGLAFGTSKHLLWAWAFVTNKHHVNLTLLVFESVALLGVLDARNAFACTRDRTSVLSATFWQPLLGWMTTGGDEELLECPNISWAIVVAVALIVVVHGYHALVHRRRTRMRNGNDLRQV